MKKLNVLHIRLIFTILFVIGIVLASVGMSIIPMIACNSLWIVFESLNIQRLIVDSHQVLFQIANMFSGAKKAVPQELSEKGEEYTHKDARIYNIDKAKAPVDLPQDTDQVKTLDDSDEVKK